MPLAEHSFDVPLPVDTQWTVCTAIVDSVAADTVHATVAMDLPCGSEAGLPPQALREFPAGGSWLVALIMGMLAMTAFSGAGIVRALRAYRNALVSVRRRNNVFDGSGRVPLPVALLLVAVFVVFGGVTLYLGAGVPESPSFAGAVAVMGLLAGYHVFQLVAYSLVGYSFSTPDGRRQWLEGFSAVQAFAGVMLIVPALLLLCMPQWRYVVVLMAVAVYIVARIVFICKGFRIFYHNIGSLLYFILYLCTLEIIPALVLLKCLDMMIIYRLHGA